MVVERDPGEGDSNATVRWVLAVALLAVLVLGILGIAGVVPGLGTVVSLFWIFVGLLGGVAARGDLFPPGDDD